MQYHVRPAGKTPSLRGNWDEPAWRRAEQILIGNFLARGSSHRPEVAARLLWDKRGLYVFFLSRDRYIRCLRTDYQANVCKDSCVEFFVEPQAGRGYFNFEINCGGTILLHYCDYPDQTTGRSRIIEKVPRELTAAMKIYHSMPQVVYPEIAFEVIWKIEYFIPFKLFEHYLGPLGQVGGQTWRGNFYKCADESSHPHWASWSPLGGKISFHVPQCFAPIKFKA